jgi:hypothetical protein
MTNRIANDGGRIVNISSGLARFALPGEKAAGLSPTRRISKKGLDFPHTFPTPYPYDRSLRQKLGQGKRRPWQTKISVLGIVLFLTP